MQQHTGQHVLSAAFERLFDARTVGFHLGAAMSTIDLAREVTPRDMASAEDEANRVVWENRPVTIRFAAADEAARLPLRKRAEEPARTGTLRLIDIDEFDLSACGGTHVARTGAIGVIAVASWERFKGGQRIEFLCGGRALSRFRTLRDTLAAATRLLSVSAEDLPGAIERLQTEARSQSRAVAGLQSELARYRAEELAASAEITSCGRLVVRAVDADANGLRSLATSITASSGYAVALVSASTPALVVVARSTDVAVGADSVIAALTARFGGRGGGKADLAQAGGLSAPVEARSLAPRDELILVSHGRNQDKDQRNQEHSEILDSARLSVLRSLLPSVGSVRYRENCARRTTIASVAWSMTPAAASKLFAMMENTTGSLPRVRT